MLSIARRPSANAVKATARIRQEHEQDDLLHLANRTQLRRVTITSPAISTPTLATTGTSASQTPPGPASEGAGNGYLWNSMHEMGEGRDGGDVDIVEGGGTGNTSPRPIVGTAFDHRTNTSISPADAFRAGPLRTDVGNGSRQAQHLRSFRALPRSRTARNRHQDTRANRAEQIARPTHQPTEREIQHSSGSTLHHTLSHEDPLSPEARLAEQSFQQSNLQGRLPLANGTESRDRHSLRVLPFEHMNAFGMPMGMGSNNQNISNRSHSQANMFRSDRNHADSQLAAQPSVFHRDSEHYRDFEYHTNQHYHSTTGGQQGSGDSNTLLYQPPLSQNHTALGTHPEGGFPAAGAPTATYPIEPEYANSASSLDMDMRFRSLGDMGNFAGMHSLDSADMEMGMVMDNMPLLPAGGSLHDVEQFIAGWHDQ